MNKLQASYVFAKILSTGANLAPAPFLYFGANAFQPFIDKVEPGAIMPGLAFMGGLNLAVFLGSSHIFSLQGKKSAKNQGVLRSSAIIIEDAKGLDDLLDITAADVDHEWGTVMKVQKRGETSYITEILDPDDAYSEGMLIYGRTFTRFNKNKAAVAGYNSSHHFHPGKRFSGVNYYVHVGDRVAGFNNVNLITFNTPGGPEVIGYNKEQTFIPYDKSILVPASPLQIFRYLGRGN